MNSHSMKKSVQRNLALPLLALLTLTGVARAQQGAGSELKAKDAADAKAMHEYMDRMQTDQKYQETIRNQQAAPASSDPWGTVRPADTPAKPAKPPVTAAKTQGGSGKSAAGSGKPAIGGTASANSATLKGQ
jgi:hypothetical protein